MEIFSIQIFRKTKRSGEITNRPRDDWSFTRTQSKRAHSFDGNTEESSDHHNSWSRNKAMISTVWRGIANTKRSRRVDFEKAMRNNGCKTIVEFIQNASREPTRLRSHSVHYIKIDSYVTGRFYTIMYGTDTSWLHFWPDYHNIRWTWQDECSTFTKIAGWQVCSLLLLFCMSWTKDIKNLTYFAFWHTNTDKSWQTKNNAIQCTDLSSRFSLLEFEGSKNNKNKKTSRTISKWFFI